MNEMKKQNGAPAPAGFDPSQDPVLCSPYEEPDRHWRLDRLGRAMKGRPPAEGRRPSMAVRSTPRDAKDFDPQTALDLATQDLNQTVNAIRGKVKAVVNWQAFGPRDLLGAAGHARKLLGAGKEAGRESRRGAAERVIRELIRHSSAYGGLVVINDEARHCWLPGQKEHKKPEDGDAEAAAVWFSAIRALINVEAQWAGERLIPATRGILTLFPPIRR